MSTKRFPAPETARAQREDGPELEGRYDVVVAGARVAGAATALLLARAGLRVLVLDPVPRGRDTLSTHALMRGAVQQLHRWGVLETIRAAGTPRVDWTSFHYADETVRVPIAPGAEPAGLYAPRRTLLDPVLVDAARAAGATFAFGWAVRELLHDRTGRVVGVIATRGRSGERSILAGRVVGADGRTSRVARLVDAPVTRSYPNATATIYGYWPVPDRNEFHWHYRGEEAVGTIPTNDGLACVFAGMPAGRLRDGTADSLVDQHLAIVGRVAPALREVISGVGPARVRGFAGAPGFLRRPQGPGWALVGDAGCFKDPLTAHGLTDALRDAELLARALATDSDAALAVYEETRDRMMTELLDITDAVASFAWDMPRLQELHLELSRCMKREAAEMATWPARVGRAVAT